MKITNQEMSPLFGLSPDDAVDLLVADHKRVARLFAEFKRLADAGDKRKQAGVVGKICQELSVHAQLEEELFYPAVREATGDDDQVDEAVVEHAGAKTLIAQLAGASPDDDLYDAKVTVLGEQIDHHVLEEEGSMFPKARHAGVDTQALAAKMRTRKAELLGDAAPADEALPSGADDEEPEPDADDRPPAKKAAARPKKKPTAARADVPKSKTRRR